MAPIPTTPLRAVSGRAEVAARSLDYDRARRRAIILAAMGVSAAAIMLWDIGHARANSGTVEEQMACTPDVFRLCSAEIPSEERIVECLNKNISKLKPACRKVMEGDSEPEQPRRRKKSG